MLRNKSYPQTLTNPRNHNHKTKHNHKTHTTTLRQRNSERKKKKKKPWKYSTAYWKWRSIVLEVHEQKFGVKLHRVYLMGSRYSLEAYQFIANCFYKHMLRVLLMVRCSSLIILFIAHAWHLLLVFKEEALRWEASQINVFDIGGWGICDWYMPNMLEPSHPSTVKLCSISGKKSHLNNFTNNARHKN